MEPTGKQPGRYPTLTEIEEWGYLADNDCVVGHRNVGRLVALARKQHEILKAFRTPGSDCACSICSIVEAVEPAKGE